ncbi:uncharacterized protein [Periplaneta americana]|uniref:uncharacterized protein n=1 Tax=Periplaneta americana TaxID=6978 RepID=UPI0037E903AC
MEEIGLPCSVITSHGECAPGSTDLLQSPTATLPYLSLAATENVHSKLKSDGSTALTDVTVYEIVSVNVWPPSTSTATILQDSVPIVNESPAKNENSISFPRKRKLRRPYSPEIHIGNKRLNKKRRGIKKSNRLSQLGEVANSPDAETHEKPFSCEKCHSPFVINPTRSHRLHSRRKYRPRRITDPVTKKVLLLCNACGLSMVRSRKEKREKEPPTQEAKDDYLKKAAEFAASLAASLQEPDARRLYCPSVFKTTACRCLQKYISGEGKDGEGSEGRALHLLSLMKEAKQLIKQKNILQTNEVTAGQEVKLGTEKDSKQKPQIPRGLQKRRSKGFEDFVLKNRRYLREELHLCERAAQRILTYSNNFLHKKLKTSPNRGCRVERVNGKNVRGLLKPIPELVNESCCNDKCVMMVHTHSKLLESWRVTAKLGQREARRVLAEMLTPSGGTKANCYKFISMVTGCSYATICLVNDQMRKTQGEREPPEHGLKKWWRDHPKEKQKKNNQKSSKTDNSDEDDPAALPDVTSIHIPSKEELNSLCPQEASNHLEMQRQKLLEVQKQLSLQQAQLRQAKLKSSKVRVNPEKGAAIPVLTTPSALQSKSIETMTVLGPADEPCADMLTRTTAQEVLHILELPTSSPPSVITSIAESVHPQSAISVMTSNGDFEQLANISVSLQGRGQTFSNVVILPQTALDSSAIAASSAAQGTSVISYSPATEGADSLTSAIPSHEQQPAESLTSCAETAPDITKTASTAVSTFQLYGVMDPTASNLLHFNY